MDTFTEMYAYLKEACYEMCVRMSGQELCRPCSFLSEDHLHCSNADGKCFVQKWLKTLEKARTQITARRMEKKTMKMKILFKRLDERAKAPTRKHEGDAGWDVTAIDCDIIGGKVHYRTGLAFAVPPGCWLMAAPRSSIGNTGMILANGIGVIDAGYRGEVQADFYRTHDECFMYEEGDRIFQLIPMPVRTDEVEFVEVDELPVSWDGRGDGGFGSTGR